MTTMLSSLEHENAAPCLTYRSDIAPRPMANDTACLIARIGWCHRQAMKALETLEAQMWCAETQGLIDALLQRDCTQAYQDRPVLLDRYAMGLRDGAMLIQAAKTRPSCHHRYDH